MTSPPAWGPLATRFSPISGDATTGFTRASDSGPVSRAQRHAASRLGLALRRIPGTHEMSGYPNHGPSRNDLHLPELRRRLWPLAGAGRDAPRLASGLAEFDRVTGGGFVRGSVLLLGGDPGIGKSTLLIQVAAALARGGHRAVYISGEEAVAQVR